MDNLITITEQNGNQVVSARELHSFLEVKTKFATWITNRIEKYEFIENQDYITISKILENGGGRTIEYALTLDTAKELSMVENNDKGKQARKYFIEAEKKLNKPLSQIDILIQSAQMIKEQEKRIASVEDKVLQIDARTKTASDYFTIVGYATLNGISCGLKLASNLGRKASVLCKNRGLKTESLPDPRFGLVKTYPIQILKEVFDSNLE